MFEVGDGRIGEAGVDVCGPVPGDRFVRPGAVVVVPINVDPFDEAEAVIDFFVEQPLVFHRPEATFASPVLARGC